MFDHAHCPSSYIHQESGGGEAIKLGYGWVSRWTEEQGGTPLLVTPTRQNVGYEPVLKAVSARLRSETPQTIQRASWAGGAVLAVWLGLKEIEALDDDYRVKALCVVPWLLEELGPWIRARAPDELSGAADRGGPPTIADAVVRAALESLTNSVNLNSALVDPRDKADAVETLRALAEGHHRFSPDELYSWAYANGWSARGARHLRELAVGVLEGHRYQLMHGYRPNHGEMLAYWREQAAQGEGST